MARDAEMDRRLNNWARWRVGMSSGGLGYASVCYEDVVDKSRDDAQAKIPTLSVEAEETDRAIKLLPSELKRTIEVVYLEGSTTDKQLRLLGVNTVRTIQLRIERAHILLKRWFEEEREKWQKLNERTRDTIEAARPK